MSFAIENAEEISRLLAGDFEIPPLEARGDLAPGDLATLLFTVPGYEPEPIRVQVTDVEGPGQYVGRLVEDASEDLFFGMPVLFDERNVAWIEAPNHPALSGMFDRWRKKPPAPPPASAPPPPPPPEVRVPMAPPEPIPEPTAYNLPAFPREMERMPVEEFRLPPVFYLPYGRQPAGGMVPTAPEETSLTKFRREEPAPPPKSLTPAPPVNPFSMWSKEAQELAPYVKPPSAFEIHRPKPPMTPAQIKEQAGAFGIWTPEPSMAPIVAPPPPSVIPEEPNPFDAWNPAEMALEAERLKQMPLWEGMVESMVPVEEQGSMYQPEKEMWAPEVPSGMVQRELEEQAREEEREVPRKSSRKTARTRKHDWSDFDWAVPSPEWMAKRLGEALNLKKTWKRVREDRLDEDWRERQMDEEAMEYGNPIPLHTVVNYEDGSGESLMDGMISIFDIDTTELQPLLDAAQKELDDEDEGPANDRLSEITQDLRNLVFEGFELIKPDDLPGTFGIYDDPNMFGNQEFIGYSEDPDDTLTPKERSQRQAEREYQEKKEREQQEKRLKKLLGNWAPMTWEQAAEFLDVNFGIQNLVQQIRKGKRGLSWKAAMAELGQAAVIIEDFGMDDGSLEVRVAKFLAIPMKVVDHFADQNEFEALWDFVFHPSFEAISTAWDNVKPDDLLGMLLANADEQDEFLLYYGEGEGQAAEDEGEEGEEGEEGD